MTQVLITGIAGFVGSKLAHRFLDWGWEVSGVDIVPPDSAERLKEISSKIRYLWGSLQDTEHLISSIVAPDYVIHTAAVTDVPFALRSPLYTLQQNVMGTANLLESLVISQPTKVVIMSSESVYGYAEQIPIPETARMNPSNIYGASKAAEELVARSYFYSHELPVIILRSSSLFGPGMRMSQVTPIFLKQALMDKPITVHGDGGQTRDFNFGENLLDGIGLALEKGRPGAIYNLSGNNEVSVKRLAEACIEVTGSRSTISFTEQRPGETGVRLVPDITLARTDLKYEPKIGFEEGLKLTAEWITETLKSSQVVIG